MQLQRLRVFTIASDAPFLDILVREILQGFPANSPAGDLANLTILVPTRRAARELQLKLLDASPQRALVLPEIRPIGDIDEDALEIGETDAQLPNAISPIGRQFALIAFIDEWLKLNPQLRLAEDISNSPQQILSLALSLGELIDTLETDEVSLDRLQEAYLIDLADHRQTILDLLDLVRKRLPATLHAENLIGAKERRSLLIRLQVRHLRDNPPKGPIIAAGSTGTIPATRELLKAISQLENGAVVLPGLDQTMDEESWSHISPQHPQFALKQLVADLGIGRMEVPVLGPAAGSRAWVASELMRPSDTADKWLTTLSGQRQQIKEGLNQLSLIEGRDKNEEAAIIALIMRRELEQPHGDIALVTPDRDLARRVKAALLRWNIGVDDSAGEPLIRFGAASLLAFLMDVASNDFNAPSLSVLFAHPLSRFGMERTAFQHIARNIDLALFRDTPMGPGLGGLVHAFARVQAERGKSRRHPVIASLSETDWHDMEQCVALIAGVLQPLESSDSRLFGQHLKTLLGVAEAVAGPEFWKGDEAGALQTLIALLEEEAHRFPPCSFNQAATVIRQQLQAEPFRAPREAGTRLSILGLLEARLLRPGTIILGGLNEGKWPRQPDAGPWLNRPMRELFAMPQPERQIGQMAHDFVQAFSAGRVYLTYSRRDGTAPAIASRWILRLATLMRAAGLAPDELPSEPWAQWAAALDHADEVKPVKIPLPCPPVAARPQRLSVTRIERLIRDPYAIYAHVVLGLEPLADVSAKPNHALRGTLFHAAIGDFFSQYPGEMPDNAAGKLIRIGQKHFAPYRDTPEIAGFWWSRFLRIARWLCENEPDLRGGPARILAEVDGLLELQVGPTAFQLSARADRIDIHADGTAHIIDFKSGSVPSSKAVKAGFSPQLTLEAAMLEHGAFKGAAQHITAAFTYVRISGGVPPGEIKAMAGVSMDDARAHLASLQSLLLKYQDLRQAYVPRFGMQREDDESDYDHLSRYREWILSGEVP